MCLFETGVSNNDDKSFGLAAFHSIISHRSLGPNPSQALLCGALGSARRLNHAGLAEG